MRRRSVYGPERGRRQTECGPTFYGTVPPSLIAIVVVRLMTMTGPNVLLAHMGGNCLVQQRRLVPVEGQLQTEPLQV